MSSQTEPEVIEAEATVIEDALSPLAEVERWLASKREKAIVEAQRFFSYEITTKESHDQAVKERASLNGVAKEINDERIAMTRSLNTALKQLKADADSAAKPVTDRVKEYDAEIKRYEADVIRRRREMLCEAYEDAAPFIALPAEDTDAPLVPFDSIVEHFGTGQMGKKWLLYGTNDEIARRQMMEAIDKVAKGEDTIRKMVAEEDRDEVLATYFSTLDMDAAMREAMELKSRRERLAKLEEERRAREEEERRLAEDARLAAEKAEAERRAAEHRAAREKAEADYAAGVRTGVLEMPGNNGDGNVTPEQMAALDAVKNGAAPQQAMVQPVPQPVAQQADSPNVPVPGQPAPATWVFAGYGNEAQMQAFRDFCQRNGIGRHTEVPTNGKQYKLTTR